MTCQITKSRSTLQVLPCLRYKLTDVSLFTQVNWQARSTLYTQRWTGSSVSNISTWASEETKLVETSHKIISVSYPLVVREYVPCEGDVLDVQVESPRWQFKDASNASVRYWEAGGCQSRSSRLPDQELQRLFGRGSSNFGSVDSDNLSNGT